MLPRDKGGVVDPTLKVYGTKNVRVVDLSILPLEVAANTQCTSTSLVLVMVAYIDLHSNSGGVWDSRTRLVTSRPLFATRMKDYTCQPRISSRAHTMCRCSIERPLTSNLCVYAQSSADTVCRL